MRIKYSTGSVWTHAIHGDSNYTYSTVVCMCACMYVYSIPLTASVFGNLVMADVGVGGGWCDAVQCGRLRRLRCGFSTARYLSGSVPCCR